MKSVCLTYVDDGRLRVIVRTIEDQSVEEIIFKLEQLSIV